MIIIQKHLNLTWRADDAISATEATTFTIPNKKLDVPVVPLSTQDNANLLQQLKSGLKEQLARINITQNQKIENQSPTFDHLIHSYFQGVNRHFSCHLKMMHTEQDIKQIMFWKKILKIIMPWLMEEIFWLP